MTAHPPPPESAEAVTAAAGTNLTTDDAQQILRHYNLHLRDLRRIYRGTINSNYFVSTDAGPAFLRVNEGKTAEDARFESELIWHLGSRGFLTPQLWRTRASEPYVMWRRSPHEAAQPVMLMTWIAAHELTEHELTDGHAFLAGVLLGQLHLCTAGFALTRPGIYTVARIKDRLQRLQRDVRAVAVAGPLLSDLQNQLQEVGAARRRDLPGGIGHGDLFPDNLLFARRQAGRPGQPHDAVFAIGPLGWILDLEQAAALPFIYDVAVALLSFCAPVAAPWALQDSPLDAAAGVASDRSPAETKTAPAAEELLGPLRRTRAQALLSGYQTMRVLGEAEWRALLSELRWAAIRFTTTRLTDVAHLGQPNSPRAPADPTPAATAQAHTIRKEASRAPQHSKDYRDFAHRLALLRTLTQDDIDKALR